MLALVDISKISSRRGKNSGEGLFTFSWREGSLLRHSEKREREGEGESSFTAVAFLNLIDFGWAKTRARPPTYTPEKKRWVFVALHTHSMVYKWHREIETSPHYIYV